MLYEQRKHDGSLPIVGVNTFVAAEGPEPVVPELRRSSEAEKQDQIRRLRAFQANHADTRDTALGALRAAVLNGGNTFDALMGTVRSCTLGEITDALFDAGGRFRRNV